MTIWDDAVADLHANAHFGEAVRWVPPTGVAVETTAIVYRPEEWQQQGPGGPPYRMAAAQQDTAWVAKFQMPSRCDFTNGSTRQQGDVDTAEVIAVKLHDIVVTHVSEKQFDEAFQIPAILDFLQGNHVGVDLTNRCREMLELF